MAAMEQSQYYSGCNQPLLRAVPAKALKILEVGCAQAHLGAALKQQNPQRRVLGIEIQPEAAKIAARNIDRVFVADIQRETPEIEPGSLDCILFGDVLEHLIEPGQVLEKVGHWLAPGGIILCSLPNFQHHSIVTALLAGDLQYTSAGLLDATHLRFFTLSTMQKLLLDAGYVPRLADIIQVPAPPGLAEAYKPAMDAMGLDSARTMKYLNAYQYILEGRPMPPAAAGKEEPVSVVACVSDETVLRNNLLASPDLRGDRHEVIAMRNARSAAEGLNRGLETAKHPLVVLAHQDVYLPKGWFRRAVSQFRKAEETFGAVGVAGVYGVRDYGGLFARTGKVVDRDFLLEEKVELPAMVNSLDELLLVMPKNSPAKFDPALGFHLYGSDICLAAEACGRVAVVLEALCFHNSRTAGLNQAFLKSAAVFLSKWKDSLPLATPCVMFTPKGEMKTW